jgi:hypothetical protein
MATRIFVDESSPSVLWGIQKVAPFLFKVLAREPQNLLAFLPFSLRPISTLLHLRRMSLAMRT